jgi:hypothetical protein
MSVEVLLVNLDQNIGLEKSNYSRYWLFSRANIGGLNKILGDFSVLKVNSNLIFRQRLFSQIFPSSKKALVVSHFSQTNYIRIIG